MILRKPSPVYVPPVVDADEFWKSREAATLEEVKPEEVKPEEVKSVGGKTAPV